MKKLSKQENRLQVLKFVLFSISAGVIQTGVFTLLNELLHWRYWPCYLIALIASVLWNFTLNREFTFKSAGNVPLAMAKVFGFYCVFTPLSTWWGSVLTDGGINEYPPFHLDQVLFPKHFYDNNFHLVFLEEPVPQQKHQQFDHLLQLVQQNQLIHYDKNRH